MVEFGFWQKICIAIDNMQYGLLIMPYGFPILALRADYDLLIISLTATYHCHMGPLSWPMGYLSCLMGYENMQYGLFIRPYRLIIIALILSCILLFMAYELLIISLGATYHCNYLHWDGWFGWSWWAVVLLIKPGLVLIGWGWCE